MLIKTKILASLIFMVILTSLTTHGDAQDGTAPKTLDQMLQSMPFTIEVQESSIFKGYQPIMDIPRNLERIYGVGCVMEMRYRGKNRPEPFPSRDIDFAPLKLTKETTLREFLDNTCSSGILTWSVINNAIHIRPTETPSEKEVYLDSVYISLDLKGVSLLEAGKAWVQAVNKNKPSSSHGVRVSHPGAYIPGGAQASRATAPSLIQEGAITLKLDNVTAREALCAIQGASTEWVIIYYWHKANAMDVIRMHPTRDDLIASPLVSDSQRRELNAQEDLGSVHVEPSVAVENVTSESKE